MACFFQLKLYSGGPEKVLSVSENIGLIGFTLPATSVTSDIIPIGSDVIFINLYSSTLCILYAVSICLLTVWYFSPGSPAKKLIDRVINDNLDIGLGIRITSATAVIVECITRLAICITWTLNTQSVSGIILGIWMPQIHLVLTGAVHLLFVSFSVRHFKRMEKKKEREQKSINEDENVDSIGVPTKCIHTMLLSCCDFNIVKSELRTFASMCATAFGLLYMFFPTIILMFAYPTQIIVIFTFVTAYLFATTVFSATIVKLYNLFKHKSSRAMMSNSQQNHQKSTLQVKTQLLSLLKMVFVYLLFITLWLVVVYLHFLAIFALYSLLIGRASVINTGPLFLVSLLPSALLSGGAWIAKRIALNDPKSINEELQDELDEEERLQSKCTAIPLEDRKQNQNQMVFHENKNSTRNRNSNASRIEIY
jgi:hypothetical protein